MKLIERRKRMRMSVGSCKIRWDFSLGFRFVPTLEKSTTNCSENRFPMREQFPSAVKRNTRKKYKFHSLKLLVCSLALIIIKKNGEKVFAHSATEVNKEPKAVCSRSRERVQMPRLVHPCIVRESEGVWIPTVNHKVFLHPCSLFEQQQQQQLFSRIIRD
jgi:hypothetical protein